MAFSGTISQTVFNTGKVIDSAVRRCKIPAQKITSEMLEIASNELYLFLSQLANQNAPLWCTQKYIYPIYDGQADIVTDVGTIDAYTVTLRTLFQVNGMTLEAADNRTYTFDTPTAVSSVGVKWSGPSKDLAFARSDDGIAWTFIEATPASPAVAGEWTWYDLASVVPSAYLMIQTADLSYFPFFETYLGNTPSEVPLGRINRDDYTNLPNKTFPSNRPVQYWLDRQVRTPVIRLWPVPNAQAAHLQLVVWAHRHIMDVGSMTQEIEVPQRWYDAVVAGLAARMAQELPEVDASMIGVLEPKAAQALMIAQGEERDNSTKRIAPDFSAYTA
jgi:hypothetical protein